MKIDNNTINKKIDDIISLIERTKDIRKSNIFRYELQKIIRDIVIRNIKVNERNYDD